MLHFGTNGSFTMPRADGLVCGLEYYTTIMAVVPGGSRGEHAVTKSSARL